MVQTQDYSTKTNFIPRKNVMVDGMWGVALDIGYSGVKGMSPNMVYCFPSFARPFNGQVLEFAEPQPDSIQYRDEDGHLWFVGSVAQDMLDTTDTNDNAKSLYGRNRYYSPMFKVLARAGIGIGMMKNDYGNPEGKTLMLQTGLPPAYLKADAFDLKDAISGHHSFDLRVGNGPWKHFEFDLPVDNIRVLAQPVGSLLSASLDNNAQMVADAAKYFNSNVLVFDAGFGTVDIYSLQKQKVESSESHDDIGMKAVLQATSDAIYQQYKVDIPVHTMQKALQNGYITAFSKKEMRTTKIDFSDILERCTRDVCMEAIKRVVQTHNYLLNCNYLLVTGGTGAAWQDIITEYFAGMEDVKVITGNQNDSLSHIFSNVRGYYLFQVGRLKKAGK